MAYIDGFVIPVPRSNKDKYRDSSAKMESALRKMGALRVVECWGSDIPDGKLTDFKKAVQATPEEGIVFSWVEWPSKEVRDAANKKMMDDPQMRNMDMPFDGKRMFFGGFDVLLDSSPRA